VIVTLRIPDWELDEERRALRVGDVFSTWLTFTASERCGGPAELVQEIRGTARPLPTWAGAELGRHPAQIDVDGGALYWDAPDPVAGAVNVVGTVSSNNVDAPDGFPRTSGVVRRVRMEWREFVMSPDGSWRPTSDEAHYEEVAASYLTAPEHWVDDPAAQRTTIRGAVRRHLSLGERLRGRSFDSGRSGFLGTPPGTAPGTVETRWTGALIDLECPAAPAQGGGRVGPPTTTG